MDIDGGGDIEIDIEVDVDIEVHSPDTPNSPTFPRMWLGLGPDPHSQESWSHLIADVDVQPS